jgi:hypothetical protein
MNRDLGATSVFLTWNYASCPHHQASPAQLRFALVHAHHGPIGIHGFKAPINLYKMQYMNMIHHFMESNIQSGEGLTKETTVQLFA